jgi:hypothetical protein
MVVVESSPHLDQCCESDNAISVVGWLVQSKVLVLVLVLVLVHH